MNKEELSKEKADLIEEMGVYFESCDTLSPLSSRIFALLALTMEKGITFEEIQEALDASKSSISTNLQILQSKGRITYCTKPGDRKRYFRIDDKQIINRLDDKIETWKQERNLHMKIINYKEHAIKLIENPDKESIKLIYNQHYITFIEAMIENLETLKTNLNNSLKPNN